MPEFRGRFGGGRGGGRGGRGGGGGGGNRYEDSDFESNPEAEKFRKLFIGGLSYETSERTLKEHYEKWGEVVDVVVMKDPASKKSRGFGFVTYKFSSHVDEAQANRPHTIDGREVECKRAMPRDGNESQELVKKLFIGGLSNDATEDDLREYFDCYGNVIKVNVIFDKETRRNKGYAFIEFDDYDPVDKCVLRKKHHINGKTADASKALPKDKDGGSSQRGRGSQGGQGYGYGGGGYGQQYGGDSYGSQGGYGGGSDYSGYGAMGQGYGDSYGGGAMRGSGSSHRGQGGPYGGGYGSSSYGSSGSGYSQGRW